MVLEAWSIVQISSLFCRNCYFLHVSCVVGARKAKPELENGLPVLCDEVWILKLFSQIWVVDNRCELVPGQHSTAAEDDRIASKNNLLKCPRPRYPCPTKYGVDTRDTAFRYGFAPGNQVGKH